MEASKGAIVAGEGKAATSFQFRSEEKKRLRRLSKHRSGDREKR
jgi:hypothetical protein